MPSPLLGCPLLLTRRLLHLRQRPQKEVQLVAAVLVLGGRSAAGCRVRAAPLAGGAGQRSAGRSDRILLLYRQQRLGSSL